MSIDIAYTQCKQSAISEQIKQLISIIWVIVFLILQRDACLDMMFVRFSDIFL
jgi:hypothetical protein